MTKDDFHRSSRLSMENSLLAGLISDGEGMVN